MILTYDLSRSPPTYDFVGALMTMEMERLKRGDPDLHIRFKPGPVGGFRRDKLPPSLEMRRQMFDQVVWPMARMLPSVRTVLMHDDALASSDMTIGHGTHLILRALRAGCRPLRSMTRVRGGYVTITLREANYWPDRNSNKLEWAVMADWLKFDLGLHVIIVRDTAMRGLPFYRNHTTDVSSATDLNVRANLYAGARLNLFTNNGPAWFCAALNAPTFIWRMTANTPATTPEFFARVGLPVGSQVPGVTICWGDDPYPQLRGVLG